MGLLISYEVSETSVGMHLLRSTRVWFLSLACSACSGQLMNNTAVPVAGSSDSPGGMTTSMPMPDEPRPTVKEAFNCSNPDNATLGGRRIWRLTRAQFDNAIAALWGSKKTFAAKLSEEVGQNGFLNSASGLRVRGTEASQFQAAAAELALEAGGQFATVFGCAVGKGSDLACQKAFVETFGLKAFRRPLSVDEKLRYQKLFADLLVLQDEKTALQGVIEAMLQSPNFLFRTELGDVAKADRSTLNAFEVASALAFSLTDAPPDETLLKTAADQSLLSAEVRVAQSVRLQQTAKGLQTTLNFYRAWLRYQELSTMLKDPSVVTKFDSLRLKLSAEMDETIADTVKSLDAKALFETKSVFLSTDTAPLWTQTPPSASGSSKVTLSDPNRKGVLTSPAVMSVLATDSRTSMVARGKFVREQMFCDVERDPPGDADLTVPPLVAGTTRRAQLDAKTKGSACVGCHALYNPVGFGLEDFDAVGRYRSTENGLAIDSSGALIGLGDVDGPFQGGLELSERLASSSDVKRCLSIQMFRYLLGRSEAAADGCALKSAHQRFETAAFALKGLPTHLFASPQFIQRRLE